MATRFTTIVKVRAMSKFILVFVLFVSVVNADSCDFWRDAGMKESKLLKFAIQDRDKFRICVSTSKLLSYAANTAVECDVDVSDIRRLTKKIRKEAMCDE